MCAISAGSQHPGPVETECVVLIRGLALVLVGIHLQSNMNAVMMTYNIKHVCSLRRELGLDSDLRSDGHPDAAERQQYRIAGGASAAIPGEEGQIHQLAGL